MQMFRNEYNSIIFFLVGSHMYETIELFDIARQFLRKVIYCAKISRKLN